MKLKRRSLINIFLESSSQSPQFGAGCGNTSRDRGFVKDYFPRPRISSRTSPRPRASSKTHPPYCTPPSSLPHSFKTLLTRQVTREGVALRHIHRLPPVLGLAHRGLRNVVPHLRLNSLLRSNCLLQSVREIPLDSWEFTKRKCWC